MLSPKNPGKTVKQGWESSGVSTNPYKLIHLKAMPPKTCQTRTAGKEKKKSKRKLIFALAKKRESWVTLLLGQC